MSSDLLHRHKVGDEPSVCQRPADCCTVAFGNVLAHAVEQARHEERRKVVLDAAGAIATYGDAAASVLPEAEAALVLKVAAAAVKALKKVGCICPYLDVSTFGQGENTTLIQGRDGRCGMHEERS